MKKPIIRFYFRGQIRLTFLVKGKCPATHEICRAQSKNPAHRGMKLIIRKRKPPVYMKVV